LDHIFKVLMYPTIVDVFTEHLPSARHLLGPGDYNEAASRYTVSAQQKAVEECRRT